ncbi:MAG: hypothetical protein V7636_2738 [Actinomycetota bacterium]
MSPSAKSSTKAPSRAKSKATSSTKSSQSSDAASEAADRRARKARTKQGSETRALLLETASTLFATKGYHNTTVPDIVKEAGIGHGTFYEYFESRRDILVALAGDAHGTVSERPKARTNSLADRLRANVYWYLLNLVEHRELTKVWHEASAFDPEIADTVRLAQDQRTKQLQRWIEELDPAPDLDAKIAATAVNAMIEEFAYRWFVDSQAEPSGTPDVLAAAETVCVMALGALGVEPVSSGG